MRLFAIRWRPGALARNGSTLLAWMLLRTAAQAATVIFLARTLGAQSYGQVVAVLAVATFAIPFVGFGLPHLLLRNAARDPANEAIYFAEALHWWERTLLPCSVIAVAAATFLLPNSQSLVASVAITAEIAAASMIELRGRHWQAKQKTHAYGAISAILPLFRLIALGLLLLFIQDISAIAVLWVYAGSGLLYTMWLWLTIHPDPMAEGIGTLEPMTVKNGLSFTLAAFAMRLQADFNKPLLAQANFGFAGSYNVAQRALEMASLPLLALQEALWPRLYGHSSPLKQLHHTGAVLLAFALTLGACIWFIAPLLPIILGDSFSNTVAVLRMLVWLPLLQVFRALLNFYVIHRQQIPLLGWSSGIGGITSIGSVASLVPTHGMMGAVLASYIVEAAMISFLLAGILQRK